MAATNQIPGTHNAVLQAALSALTQELYTNAKKVSGTGIVSTGHEGITTDTETYVGQMRWAVPLNPVINRQSLTDATDGVKTTSKQDYLTYVKSARSHGAGRVNAEQIVTQQNSMQKIANDLSETRGQDEHNALFAMLKGVAATEVLMGAKAAGGQTFDNDPKSKDYGFYVDLGTKKLVADATAAQQGAARADAFLQALGMGFKDYEPQYAYLLASPETIASLRSANLVDSTRVVDGQLEFDTIFQGKLRLIVTRQSQHFSAAELTALNSIAGEGTGMQLVGTKTSFIIRPGALALIPLNMPKPVEIDSRAAAYGGAGTEELWYRWGYIAHPGGYSWAGKTDEFAMDADYMSVLQGGTQRALAGSTPTAGVWTRKADSVLTLGILPVFHN